MTDLSTPAAAPLVNGPESTFVVTAVDALLRNDVIGARMALIEGAGVHGWGAIAHRLDVVGHALAIDAGLGRTPDRRPDAAGSLGEPVDDTDVVVLLPDVDTSKWTDSDVDTAHELMTRWSNQIRDDALPVDRVWSSLAVVAWLVEQAGYPPQVVV